MLLPYDNANRFVKAVGQHKGPLASWTAWVAPRTMKTADAARQIGAGPVRLVGSGAPKIAVEAWQIGLDATVVSAADAPDILWVARLGALADPDEAPPKPLYLKPPDAKPMATFDAAGR